MQITFLNTSKARTIEVSRSLNHDTPSQMQISSLNNSMVCLSQILAFIYAFYFFQRVLGMHVLNRVGQFFLNLILGL